MNKLKTTFANGITRYEIRFQGHLTSDWQDWFEGFSLVNESDGSTVLTGNVEDQAALQGGPRQRHRFLQRPPRPGGDVL